MKENTTIQITKYFAASNSYHGFISFFDKIFNSKDYERIYVLKGGPGTGKNSFMKKVSSEFRKVGCDIEEIYCSSDPNSLDGVIVKLGQNIIAVLDGTAPHERDAIIPGTIDEIINLGEGWDTRWLIAKRDKICDLIKNKSQAYRCAYSYLKLAGAAEDYVLSEYTEIFDKKKIKNKAEELFLIRESKNIQNISLRLTSAFGKYGHYKIENIDNDSDENIHICGDKFASFLVLDEIEKMANSIGMSYIQLKYPLNPFYSEGLCFDDKRISIIDGDSGDILSNEYLLDDKLYLEHTRVAKEIINDALLEAQRWFSIASELHFELEKIYGQAMNFEKNNEILDIKLREMKNILQI